MKKKSLVIENLDSLQDLTLEDVSVIAGALSLDSAESMIAIPEKPMLPDRPIDRPRPKPIDKICYPGRPPRPKYPPKPHPEVYPLPCNPFPTNGYLPWCAVIL